MGNLVYFILKDDDKLSLVLKKKDLWKLAPDTIQVSLNFFDDFA